MHPWSSRCCVISIRVYSETKADAFRAFWRCREFYDNGSIITRPELDAGSVLCSNENNFLCTVLCLLNCSELLESTISLHRRRRLYFPHSEWHRSRKNVASQLKVNGSMARLKRSWSWLSLERRRLERVCIERHSESLSEVKSATGYALLRLRQGRVR